MESSLASLEEDRATEKAAYEAVLATLKGETEGLRIKMEAQQTLLTPAADAAATLASELETAKTELRLLRDQSEAAGREQVAAAAQLQDAQAALAAKQAELASVTAEQAAATTRRKALSDELEKIAAEESVAVTAASQAGAKVSYFIRVVIFFLSPSVVV